MNEKNKAPKIGIFGHYGNENLGDEAIIQAVIQNLRQRIPKVSIVCFSINPQDSAQRYQVPAYPIRDGVERQLSHAQEVDEKLKQDTGNSVVHEAEKQAPDVQAAHAGESSATQGLKKLIKNIPIITPILRGFAALPGIFREVYTELLFLLRCKNTLKDIDLLMITGSNQFLDNFGGAWGFPYTLLKWSILAKLTATKLAFVSVGAGPLEAPLSRFMVRFALCFADYYSYRDVASKQLIESGGIRKSGLVYPDLAQSLDMSQVNVSQGADSQRTTKVSVGINLMPMYDQRYWCETDQGRYSAFIEKMTDFAARLIEQGYPIFLYATQPKDEYALRDLVDQLHARGCVQGDADNLIKRVSSVYELMTLIAEADVLIPTRFHGVVLSLLSEKATLGICYYRKSADLLTEMGQQEYAVDLDQFSAETLYDKFEHLITHYIPQKKLIVETNKRYRTELDEQYDLIIKKFF